MINLDELDEFDRRRLGRKFLRAVGRGIPDIVASWLEEGMPVNYQDPGTKQAALHVAAGCQARYAIRVLAKQPDCNFLLRDRHGRLPSELAYAFGNDPALARYLGNKERKQAEAQGLKLTRRRTLPALTVITPN